MTIIDAILSGIVVSVIALAVIPWLVNRTEKSGPMEVKPLAPPPVQPIKVFRRKYKYIVVEHHDERSLNDTAEKYQNEGYVMDREKSTDHLLVFVKSEEVESKPSAENLTNNDKNP